MRAFHFYKKVFLELNAIKLMDSPLQAGTSLSHPPSLHCMTLVPCIVCPSAHEYSAVRPWTCTTLFRGVSGVPQEEISDNIS